MPGASGGTALARRLGIEPGQRIRFQGTPEGYDKNLKRLPPDVEILYSPNGQVDMVHLFVRDLDELETAIPDVAMEIRSGGAVWVSWPREERGDEDVSGSDLTLGTIQETALAHGLVDVSIQAIDEAWGGVKLVPRPGTA